MKYIGSGHFFFGGGGFKILNFNILGGSDKWILFWIIDFVDFFFFFWGGGGSSQNWTIFRGYFYTFEGLFLMSRYRMGVGIFGVAKISNILLGCLKFLIFLGMNVDAGPEHTYEEKNESTPPPPPWGSTLSKFYGSAHVRKSRRVWAFDDRLNSYALAQLFDYFSVMKVHSMGWIWIGSFIKMVSIIDVRSFTLCMLGNCACCFVTWWFFRN